MSRLCVSRDAYIASDIGSHNPLQRSAFDSEYLQFFSDPGLHSVWGVNFISLDDFRRTLDSLCPDRARRLPVSLTSFQTNDISSQRPNRGNLTPSWAGVINDCRRLERMLQIRHFVVGAKTEYTTAMWSFFMCVLSNGRDLIHKLTGAF